MHNYNDNEDHDDTDTYVRIARVRIQIVCVSHFRSEVVSAHTKNTNGNSIKKKNKKKKLVIKYCEWRGKLFKILITILTPRDFNARRGIKRIMIILLLSLATAREPVRPRV